MKQVSSAGGWHAIRYALSKGRQAGGVLKLYKALRSNNACKTCALGMGGQLGGMVNEIGHFPEVCKKSIQAMTADMQGAIPPQLFSMHGFDHLSQLSPRELEKLGRLTQPLYAGPLDTTYRVINWDDALDRIASKLNSTRPDETFFYMSGRSSNEAAFLLQVFARLYGTNNVNNCSYYCHQASGVGLSSVTGSGTATVVLDDIEGLGRDDLIFLIGANPASNHPRLMTTLVKFRRRGGKVIVVNPLREQGLVKFKVPSNPRSLLFGSTIADEYVQPHIGGDIAFLTGVAKAVIEAGAQDSRFVEDHADGWSEFAESVRLLEWDRITEQSGVDEASIRHVADLYGSAPNAVFCWAMGITHHAHGVQNVQAIANLAMTRGMLGRPKAGLLPLRGHSNVQGVGSMGVTPSLKKSVFDALEDEFGVAMPREPGLDTMGAMVRAAEGEIGFALCLGGNLFGSNPDSAFAAKALRAINMLVYVSTTLNTGHMLGRGKETLILPVLARDEEPAKTTQESMFNYVRVSDGGPRRHDGPRSEVSVIADIAERSHLRGPVDWAGLRDHGAIRGHIARVIPGYEAIDGVDSSGPEFRSGSENLSGSGARSGPEFQIAGRTFHEPQFDTESGRARFHVVDLPEMAGGNGNLRLMTVRSEGQFNTVVYEEEDIYRGQDRRDVIMMNQSDIERMGLTLDRRVEVRSATGSISVLVRAADIPRGNAAMYYPEANILIPRTVDPASRTPAFKSVLVEIAG